MERKKKMNKGIITDGEEDRISNLPESLIHHILSFLLMRDVIRTCLLSKRWRNIWKSVPVLNFGHSLRRIEEFIDQSLIHYEGQKVKTLQVDFGYCNDARCLESCVRFAAMHGVEEFGMFADLYGEILPDCLFECLEMRVLTLGLDECPKPFHFPLLTELRITVLKWNYLDTSACPLLKVLIVEEIFTMDSLEIYAPNPKLWYLDITEPSCDFYDNTRLILYAPNVLHFEFEGSFERFYEFRDISSVQTLSLYSSVEPNADGMASGMAESLLDLLRNLTHVKSLILCETCILILAYGETIGLEIPSLNATCLELQTNFTKCVLVGVASLLRASRCIKRLIIDMGNHYAPDETVFEGHNIVTVKAWEALEHALSVDLALNTISIQNYPGYPRYRRDRERKPDIKKYRFEVKLVEVLLKSSKMLKKMNISIMNCPSGPLNLLLLHGLTKKLLVFPRASLKAKVYFT